MQEKYKDKWEATSIDVESQMCDSEEYRELYPYDGDIATILQELNIT